MRADKSEAQVMKFESEEVTFLLEKLIEETSVNPSLDPSSSEKAVAELILHELEASNIEVRVQKVSERRFNVIGQITGEDPHRSIMLNGHMDTVGIKEPIRSFVDERGRIHGRGACDMKGGLVAMILALKKLKQNGGKLNSTVQFSAVVDEEGSSLGTQKLLTEYKPTAVIVGEPTELGIAIAQKGAQRFEVETFGKSAHGGSPELGIDAIANMALVIQKLGEMESSNFEKHPLLGRAKIHTSTIEGGKEWTTVPDYCKLRAERRSLPNEPISGQEKIKRILDELATKDPKFSGRVTLVLERKPMETSESEEIVTLMQIARSRILGPSSLIGVPFWTDAAFFATDRGIPTCIFGPGNVAQAHSDDEYIEVDQVAKAAQVYALIAQLF
jgi:acetylornithine deacetylase/succinyl-diaminopimelate desuccinylase family protein